MASVSKFYLRASSSSSGGTLPGLAATVSASTPTKYGASMANLYASGSVGSSQTSVAGTTNSGTTAQSMLICRWISDPLNAQTIASQTITFSGAFSEDDAKSNFLPSVVVAIWRPSTGALVGRIYDQATNVTEPGTSETAGSFTATSTSQTASAGDVLVFEVWRKSNAQATPGNAAVNTVYYDGTTEASSSNNAAFVGFTTAVSVQTTWTATADVTVSPSAAATPEAMVKSTIGQAVTVSPAAASDAFLFATQRTTISGSDAKTYGTITGRLGRAGSQSQSATASTTVSPTAAAVGAKTHVATADTTVSPSALASLGAVTKSTTADTTVGPTTSATPAAMTKSTTATGTTVGPTTSAVPAAITDQATADATVSMTAAASGSTAKASTATGVTVSPTADSTPAAMSKSTTATGVTVAPSALADPAAIVDTATASTTVSPTTSAVPAAMTKATTATGATVSPTTAAVPGASTKPATASGVTVSPIADAVPAAMSKASTADATVGVSSAAAGQVWRQRWFKPDAILSMSGLSGTVSEIQDSPTSPDANALDPTGGAVAVRISFENHGQELRTNTGDQVIRILASTP